MKRKKCFRNMSVALITLMAVTFAGMLASCSFTENNAEVSVVLPQTSVSSSRAIGSDDIGRLKTETASYRVYMNDMMFEGTGGKISAMFIVGTKVDIFIECLNSSGQVIVRTVTKSINVQSIGRNEVYFNLSIDGTEIEPSAPPAPPPPPQSVPVYITFEAGHYISYASPKTWGDMAGVAPPQAGDRNAGAQISETMSSGGYTFRGWVVKENYNQNATDYSQQSIIQTYPNTAATLVGIWEENAPNTYGLSYSWGDGVTVSAGSLPQPESNITSGENKTVTIPTGVARDGYRFMGWSETQGSQTATYTSGGSNQINITQNIVLYAVWAQTYTITFAGTNDSSTPPPTLGSYIAGENVSFSWTPSRTGYVLNSSTGFGGSPQNPSWSASVSTLSITESNVYNWSFNMPAENVTLTAQWTEITYTITYAGGSGASGSVPSQTFKVTDGTVQLSDGTGFNKSGQSVSKWNSTPLAGGSGVEIGAAGGTVNVSALIAVGSVPVPKPEGSVTLTAVWEETKYKITFNWNAGNDNVTGTLPETISVSPGGTATIPFPSVSRAGYTFLGWSTSSTNSSANYNNVNNQMGNVTANTPLYAIWKENVAEVNGSAYTDFMTAFSAVQPGQTLKLLKNVNITSTLAITKNMTLDLNGCTLSGNNSFGLISINNANVTFTLNDSTGGNNGTLTGGNSTNSGGGAVLISNGKFVMNGGKISGNTANRGGGVYLMSGTFEMNGGVITGNHSSSNLGGGVYVLGGTTVNISGDITVKDNTGGSSSAADNFMLQGVVLNITGKITSGNNSIGIYYSGTNPFTSGWQANGNTESEKTIFFSDNTSKTISYSNGELEIS